MRCYCKIPFFSLGLHESAAPHEYLSNERALQ